MDDKRVLTYIHYATFSSKLSTELRQTLSDNDFTHNFLIVNVPLFQMHEHYENIVYV